MRREVEIRSGHLFCMARTVSTYGEGREVIGAECAIAGGLGFGLVFQQVEGHHVHDDVRSHRCSLAEIRDHT